MIKGLSVGGFGLYSFNTRVKANEQSSREMTYVVLSGEKGIRHKLQEKNLNVLHEIGDGAVIIAEGPEGKEEEVRSIPVINDIIPNYIERLSTIQNKKRGVQVDSEPYLRKQWDKNITNTVESHDIATGDGTSIAIIDTGVDHSHPDLEPVIDTRRGRLIHNGRIHSGTRTNRVRRNPFEETPLTKTVEGPSSLDIDGHGTHVAGIAAASSNETGIVGVAPDTSVVPIRAAVYKESDTGGSELQITLADILLAIDYAVETGVDVINISLGLGPLPEGTRQRRFFAAFRRLIQYAIEEGVIVVVSGGNQSVNLENYPFRFLPSSNRGVISVAATGPNDKKSFISNYGQGIIDVAAPGGGYETVEKTTRQDGVDWPYPTNQIFSSVPQTIFGNNYQYQLGTSMAASQVAGLACLVREVKPNSHPRRVKYAIKRGAVETAGKYTSELGGGRINVSNTLSQLREVE